MHHDDFFVFFDITFERQPSRKIFRVRSAENRQFRRKLGFSPAPPDFRLTSNGRGPSEHVRLHRLGILGNLKRGIIRFFVYGYALWAVNVAISS